MPDVEHPPQRAFHATESAARTQVEPHAGRWYLEGHDPTTDGAAAERQVAGTRRGPGGGRRGGFVYALYARQTRDVLSDWDPTWVGTQALLHGQSPYAAIQVPPVAQLSAVPPARAPAHGSVHVHPARRRARALRRDRRRGVHFRHHRARPLDPLPPDQRRDAVELDRRAVASAADGGRAGPQLLLAARGEAHPRPGPLVRLPEPQGRHRGRLLVGLCFLVWPGWVPEWLASVARTPHKSHLLRPGGFLLLLALLRWRRPEARLLAVLSLMPQTTALYEALPLALAAERKVEAAAFATPHDGGPPALPARAAGALARGRGVSVVGDAAA